MKILLVSFVFPPCNAIGAVRIGKLAKYLLAAGHEVRVLTAAGTGLPETLAVEIPADRIRHTGWRNINWLPFALLHRRAGDGKKPDTEAAANGAGVPGWLDRLGWLYRLFLNVPDGQVGWLGPAVRAGDKLIEDWRPDLIYASAMPFTSLWVASRLARRHRLPWVGELRDLWVSSPYYDYPRWRRALERRLERHVLRDVAGLVTVSEPLAKVLRQENSAPVAVVLNGYDPDDYSPPPESLASTEPLVITYTGIVYPGRRDPAPLFAAIARLGWGPEQVRVRFYGRKLEGVAPLAAKYGMEDVVEVHEPVSFAQSTALQQASDILLLLLWNDPEEEGVFTGKLFEYLGARRPILSLGLENGVAADLIRKRQAGYVGNDPAAIASQLESWRAEKLSAGIPALAADVGQGLTRADQFARLEGFITGKVLPLARQGRRIRVLVVIGQLEIGGAETHLQRVMSRLDPERFEIIVYALRPGGPVEDALRAAGVTVLTPSRRPRSVLGMVRVAWHLLRSMRRLRPDILHFFLPESYVLGACCSLCIPGTIRIMSRRSLNNYQQRFPLLKPLERILHPYMHAVLGNSAAVVRQLRQEGIAEDRLGLIYNGIEVAQAASPDRDGLRQRLGIEPDTLLLVVVANLIPYKGHQDLLQALVRVRGRMPGNWQLVCLGRDDGHGEHLQRYCREQGLAGHVSWPGDSDDVAAWMQAADIGVLPSHEEGFSNSLLEGMAAGLAMVVTDVGGNPEAVEDGHSGLVVAPRDPEALGTALLRLAGDPLLRRRLGDAARERIAKRFNLRRCVGDYELLYQGLMGSHGRRLPGAVREGLS